MAKITKIEKISYKGLVYNLEVEEDNSYCTELFILHNCQDPVNPGSYFDIVQFPSLDTCPNCQAYKEVAMKPLAESMAAKALQKNQ